MPLGGAKWNRSIVKMEGQLLAVFKYHWHFEQCNESDGLRPVISKFLVPDGRRLNNASTAQPVGRETMRFVRLLFFTGIAVAGLTGPSPPQTADDWFRLYAVHVNRTPRQPWIGVGVYLGSGIMITAAYVAGLGFWRKPQVESRARSFQ